MNDSKKQNFLNLTSNLLALIIQFSINFLIIPKIISNFGTEAVGYVNISTDITSYFSVFTIVFNSVAGRFISIEINKGNSQKATEYLNSVIAANAVLSAIIALAGIIFIPNAERFLNITPQYVNEVKLTFLITWISFIISVMTSVFTVGTYVKNKLDVNAVRNIISYLLRVVAIVILFTCLPMKIYFMPFATLISTIFLAFANFSLTKKYLPELKLGLKYAKLQSIKEIASSGIWMSFISLSNILIRGLDNVIANLMFDQVAMGNLSTSRTIPNAITTIINTVGTIFTPTFVYYYSQNKINDIVEQAKKSIRINGLILLVPVSGVIGFAQPFYSLWLKDTDPATVKTIILLSSITVVQAYFNSSTSALSQLSVVTNKLKLPVFVSFGAGILNIIAVLIVAKTTNLGVLTLSLTSTVIMSCRYIFFNSWYAAKVLNTKSKYFYKTLLKTLSPIPLLLAFYFFVANRVVLNSWLKLIVVCGICGIIGYIISGLIILPKQDIKDIFNKIRSKIKN